MQKRELYERVRIKEAKGKTIVSWRVVAMRHNVFNMCGRNKADAGSMKAAIRLAVRMVKTQRPRHALR